MFQRERNMELAILFAASTCTFRPPICSSLLSLDFVGDSPFSVYSPALPSNLLTPGNTCVSGPQHDKKPTCRRTFSARAKIASWRLSARWPLLHHRRSPMASQFDPASTHQVFLRSYLSNYIRQQIACYDASFF